jgi:UDP-N-acetylmuramate dehydrogenase
VLGGGSNLLISDAGFNGLVIKVQNKGIEILSQDENQVLLKVASGENWDEVVKFAVTNNWWGIENLSHIPGSTGAIAVQNVGAYGQEAKNVIDSVVVFNKETHEIQSLKAEDCGFGYRSSIFNTAQKGKYIIFCISFKLSKIPAPILSYRDLQNKFSDHKPSLQEIRDSVIEIRDKKFPFPTEAKKGNAGSFFKNPVLSERDYNELKELVRDNFGTEKAQELDAKKFNESIDTDNSRIVLSRDIKIKVPAAFLIDLCGLKDLTSGGAGINANQPLVIINQNGQAAAQDVLSLANKVKAAVLAKTGIELKFEPELIGFE